MMPKFLRGSRRRSGTLLPLQAADMLAYWSRRQLSRHLGFYKGPETEWEEALIQLASPNREVHWRFYGREVLVVVVPHFLKQRPDLVGDVDPEPPRPFKTEKRKKKR